MLGYPGIPGPAVIEISFFWKSRFGKPGKSGSSFLYRHRVDAQLVVGQNVRLPQLEEFPTVGVDADSHMMETASLGAIGRITKGESRAGLLRGSCLFHLFFENPDQSWREGKRARCFVDVHGENCLSPGRADSKDQLMEVEGAATARDFSPGSAPVPSLPGQPPSPREIG